MMSACAVVWRSTNRLRVVRVDKAGPRRGRHQETCGGVSVVGRWLRRQEIQPGKDLQVNLTDHGGTFVTRLSDLLRSVWNVESGRTQWFGAWVAPWSARWIHRCAFLGCLMTSWHWLTKFWWYLSNKFMSPVEYYYTTIKLRFFRVTPRAGSGVVRMDPLRFLAGCRTRRLNQV